MIDISRDIDSLSEFKRNTKAFVTRLKKSGAPVVLTINGRAAVVVQDAAAYQKMRDREARQEMEEFLRESIADAEAGRTVDALEFLRSLGKSIPKEKRRKK